MRVATLMFSEMFHWMGLTMRAGGMMGSVTSEILGSTGGIRHLPYNCGFRDGRV